MESLQNFSRLLNYLRDKLRPKLVTIKRATQGRWPPSAAKKRGVFLSSSTKRNNKIIFTVISFKCRIKHSYGKKNYFACESLFTSMEEIIQTGFVLI